MNFCFGRAKKYESLDQKRELESDEVGQKCRFGRCWWYWLPQFKARLNTPYKMIEVKWLCFWASYEGC